MPTRRFRDLLEAMPPAGRRRIESRFQKGLPAMPLDQLRKVQQMAQLQLAEILGVNQGEIAKIESRSDICVSTLAEYIEATGRRLEIRAVFNDREVRITQFEDCQANTARR
jgi:transcriptional regulator with XRE-family HTH domain